MILPATLPLHIGLSVKNRAVLLKVYNRLLSSFGLQHWWPGDSPFEVMVGAVLTQSTAWRNVEKAIDNLKAADALSPEALHQMPAEKIAALIRPSGYYNQKARKMKALVDWLAAEHQGNPETLALSPTGELRAQLLDLLGIGPETADSILLYAANRPVFVIDAYTRRIISRLGLAPQKNTYDEYQNLFMRNLPSDVSLFNEYHALLVRLGKTACRKEPGCDECCLFDICQYDKARLRKSCKSV
jgi:endonuclease-3 related protein